MNYFFNDQNNQAAQNNNTDQNTQTSTDDTADISNEDVKSDMNKIFDHSTPTDNPFADDHTQQSQEDPIQETENAPKEPEHKDEPIQPEIHEEKHGESNNVEFVQSTDPTPPSENHEKLEIEELRYKGRDSEEASIDSSSHSSSKDPGIMTDIEEKLLSKKSVLDKQRAELDEKISKIEEMLHKINIIKDQAGEVIKFSEEI